nr:immunoglobulin heavy chain junction region [Macaca mulatta]MOX92070.1 immunoglobulin heavy chain junction region [Macaca mulatta]MOX93148.1 immunoglobulin heavy chain junction region [Macaca mulatta]
CTPLTVVVSPSDYGSSNNLDSW